MDTVNPTGTPSSSTTVAEALGRTALHDLPDRTRPSLKQEKESNLNAGGEATGQAEGAG
jgi:hypothetical protein